MMKGAIRIIIWWRENIKREKMYRIRIVAADVLSIELCDRTHWDGGEHLKRWADDGRVEIWNAFMTLAAAAADVDTDGDDGAHHPQLNAHGSGRLWPEERSSSEWDLSAGHTSTSTSTAAYCNNNNNSVSLGPSPIKYLRTSFTTGPRNIPSTTITQWVSAKAAVVALSLNKILTCFSSWSWPPEGSEMGEEGKEDKTHHPGSYNK